MSEMAKKARAAMKEKAQGRAAPTKGSIDASGWSEPTMNTAAKVGMRPISRRQFKKGGKVEGEHGVKHAGKAPRKGKNLGGQMNTPDFTADDAAKMAADAKMRAIIKADAEANAPIPRPRRDRIMDRLPTDRPFAPEKRGGRTGRKNGGKAPLTADSLINRDVKEANEERGYPHTGGYKKGGKAYANGGYKRGGYAGGGYKKGGEVHEDAAMDKKLIKAEMSKHAKGCTCKACGGRMGKEDGGSAMDYLSPVAMAMKNPKMLSPLAMAMGKKKGGSTGNYEGGTRPTGGRIARDKGGKTERSPELQELYDQRANTNGHKARARIQDQIDKMEGKYKAPSMLDAMDPYERTARKSGGRAKKTNIIITFNAEKHPDGVPAPMGLPPAPVRPPMPVAPPPMAGGAGMPPMGPPPAPMGGGLPPGLGVPPPAMGPMARKAGGRVGHRGYSSYKDMDAGAGGGLGRLEKTEIQKKKG